MLNLQFRDKELILNNGLTISVDNIKRNSFYNQFKRNNLFGVNFNWGKLFSQDNCSDLKIFVFDEEIFDETRVVGYFGQCLNVNVNNSRLPLELMANAFENNKFGIIIRLLNFLHEDYINTVDLIFVNNIDRHLTSVDKMIFFKVFEQISKIKPVLIVTSDVASLRLSDVKFQLLDETNKVGDFFELVEAIQNNKFERFVEMKIKQEQKNAKNNKRRKNKKI